LKKFEKQKNTLKKQKIKPQRNPQPTQNKKNSQKK